MKTPPPPPPGPLKRVRTQKEDTNFREICIIFHSCHPGSDTRRDNGEHTHNTMARGGVCQGSSNVEKP